MLNFFFLALGLWILIKGSDFLVDGGGSIAKRFNIPPIVIGLTIVAFGTSAPEFLVSLISSLQGASDIALGNIFGSNIANILLILGVVSFVSPIKISRNTIWKEIPMTMMAAVIVTILGLSSFLDNYNLTGINLGSTEVISNFGVSSGLILLIFFIIFIYYTVSISRNSNEEVLELDIIEGNKAYFYFIFGVVLLGFGSNMFVQSAINIAEVFGLAQGFVGLTLVAFGTSLPELAASVNAARKGQSQMAIGNVIGSNIYNIFFVLGFTTLVSPVPLTGHNLADILMLLFSTGFLFFSCFILSKHTITKIEGTFMLWAYSLYLIYIYLR